MPDVDLYGKGMSFPPRCGADGRIAWSSDEQNVRECLRVLLLTEPGERIERPDFGCGLRRYLFEPNTLGTRRRIAEAITRAIQRWEPRVALEEVTVEPDDSDLRLVAITISFRLVATRALERVGLTLLLEG